MTQLSSYELACISARILDNKLAKEIMILNISNVSVVADYFVICSADSTTQVRTLTESIKDKIKENYEMLPTRSENDLKNRWNLVDYSDVIIHVLHKEERQFYALEQFWNHACTINEDEWMKATEELKDKLL
ncbi:MAG: ribosome silencing factor [bacterium]